jgi:tRNA threonylcarbamoyl adenosine modification protein YjeE
MMMLCHFILWLLYKNQRIENMSFFLSDSEHYSSCAQDTIELATHIARDLKKEMILSPAPIAILLEGDLGMGKSTFARAFIREWLDDPTLNVPSPTFTIVQYYPNPVLDLYHYDLYRLNDSDELQEIGWDDSLASGINLIEWPSRIMPYHFYTKVCIVTIKPPQNNGNPEQRRWIKIRNLI